MNVLIGVFKERLVANLARIIGLFAFLVRVVLCVDSFHCLQFNSLLVELSLSSFVCLFISLVCFVTKPLGQSFVVLFSDVFEVRIFG